MRKTLFLAGFVILSLVTALPASADGYAQCGSGGYGYTSTDLAAGSHTHHFGPSHVSAYGHGYVRVAHGWQTGSNYWYFTGSSYGIEVGTCVS